MEWKCTKVVDSDCCANLSKWGMKLVYRKFKGEYNHSLDSKNRVFIPAKYREVLGNSFTVCRGSNNEPTLYIFPAETWDELCEEMDEKGRNAVGEEKVLLERDRRDLYRYSDDANMDTQGRITLSQSQIEYARLKKDVLILGNMKRLEIWDPEVFREFDAKIHEDRPAGTPDLNF